MGHLLTLPLLTELFDREQIRMPLPLVRDIEAGTSILFLGAGFSAEATNVNDEEIRDVSGLIDYLLDKVGITSSGGYDLDSAAEEFFLVHKEQKTAEALHSNFRSKTVTADQRVIVTQPWYRIYTTNYDDVIERICTEEIKPLTTLEVSDPADPPMPGTTQLIHICGNITRSSVSEFKKHFLLTESQRDNSPFFHSHWMRRFHDDVLAASSLIFVGFSLTDIDMRRLLGSFPAEIQSKIHFVVRPTTLKPIQNRMARFGQVHAIGLSALAGHLASKRPGRPIPQYNLIPTSIQELHFEQKTSSSVSSRDIDTLLISGEVDLKKLAEADITGSGNSYTIPKSLSLYQRASQNSSGDKPILVHGDIGNGKTIFAYQLGYQFSQKGYHVYRVQREPESIGEIVAFFQALDNPAVVIFDDIMHFPTLPAALINLSKRDIIIIATTRTIVLDTLSERLRSRLGNKTAIEIDLNLPRRDESLALVNYLDVNGLWGAIADQTDKEKLDFVERTCGSQLRDVILSLYERGSLHQKVENLLLGIQALKQKERELIVLSALMSYADFQQSSQFLVVADLVGYNGSLEEFRSSLLENELISLIRIDTSDVLIKSPALADFILGRVFSIDTILSIVQVALEKLDKYYVDDDEFMRLAKGLLKFSLYGRWIKTKRDNDAIESFYDKGRVLSFASKDPLFWVQRSICNMHMKCFDISYRFVETAYGLAKKMPRFDPYQIDNHHARLMLTQSREEGVSTDGLREREALKLLQGILDRKSTDLYHPLSVMRVFAEIVDHHAKYLTNVQKSSLKSSIDDATKYLKNFRASGRFRNLPELKDRLDRASKRLNY
jgi:hypothetical protein